MDTLLALPNGTELAGDYRIERVLGAGGFGITYLAEETPLHRAVAIKEYFPSDFASREGTTLVRSKSRSLDEDYQWGLERFIEEAQALARFDHANIVRVYRYFRANNTGYMVLQHEPGASFKGWLDGLGRPPLQEEMDRIIGPLLEALESIHNRDFLHRDIAPDNIIIRPDGSPVLIDFGSARREIARHARTVSVLVKPGYSPFEQYAETGKQQGPWTDIYALAATLYHGVTGRRPHDAPTRMTQDDVVPASQLAGGRYRPNFLHAIDHGLMLAVEARPQNIRTWREELLGALKAPVLARPFPVAEGLTLAPTRKIADDEPEALPFWHARQQELPAEPALRPAAEKAEASPKARAAARDKAAKGKAAKGAKVKPVAAAKSDGAKPVDAVAPRQAMQQRMGMAVATPAPPVIATPRRSLMALLSDVGANVRASLPSGSGRKAPADTTPALAGGPAVSTPDAAAPVPGAATLPAVKPAVAEMKTVRARRTRPWWAILRGPVVRVVVVVGVVSAMVYGERHLRPDSVLRPSSLATLTDLSLAQALRAHTTPVVALAFSGNGQTLASIGTDGMIRLWDARSGVQQRTIVGTPDATSLDISQDIVGAGSSDGRIRFWDMTSGQEIRSFDARAGAIRSILFGGSVNQIFEAGQDGRIRSFDQRGNPRGVIGDHPQPVLALAYAVGPRLLVSGGADHQVKLWDERRRRLIRSYDGHTENVDAVAIVADGSVLASGSNDHSVVVWDGSSPREIVRLNGHTGRVIALAFSPSGQMLASASEDGTVKLWDWSKGQLLHTYEGHISPVRALAFQPDGKVLASAGDDAAIRLWNARVTGYR